MGNVLDTSILELLRSYMPRAHPICGPLIEGGPALLVKEYSIPHTEGYVDACHLCYYARRALLDRFPQYLTPRQVYGFED